MFEKITEKGTIRVTEEAMFGMLTQQIQSESIDGVKFIGLRKLNAGTKIITGISKIFVRSEKSKEQEIVDNTEIKLTFDAEFKVTQIHPLHEKAIRIQEIIEQCITSTLGLEKEQIIVNVHFIKFEKEVTQTV
jgi:uncharacterized alkaline shock family protein YloU